MIDKSLLSRCLLSAAVCLMGHSAPAWASVPDAEASPPPSEGFTVQVERTLTHGFEALLSLPGAEPAFYKLYGMATMPKVDTPVVSNTCNLAPGLMRGAQPTAKGFVTLKRQGVATVINLRPEEEWEKPLVLAAGMRYLYLPLPSLGAPSNEQALAFLRMATDPANGAVFFHCLHGADRTGAMAAAYRIAAQGWSVERAIAELGQYGFHAGFQDDKLDFIRQFAPYWHALPEAEKARVLHRTTTIGQ